MVNKDCLPNTSGFIVTDKRLAKAIENSAEGTINREEAKRMAYHMLNFFGYSDRIIDNILEPEDRDVFYMMEDNGILMTEREETTLHDGREWRINYWLFCKDKIYELGNNGYKKPIKKTDTEFTVYDDIPEETWARG